MARTYTLTAASVLAKARVMIGDKRPDLELRNSDAELIGNLNEALASMVSLLPGLFAVVKPFACGAGYLQVLESERAAVLMNVVGVPECDETTLTQWAPGWPTSPAGSIENWMRLPGDPLRFMVYPPAAATAPLTLRYAESPLPLVAVSDLVPVPELYEPALVEYVAGRSELQDDEHVNSGRAAALLDRFVGSVKALGTA